MQTIERVSIPKALLGHLVRLRDDIEANGPSERLLIARRFAVLALKGFRLQEDHERTSQADRVRSRWLEPTAHLTDEDRRNLAEARRVNREIAGIVGGWRKRQRQSKSWR
jgi:hypothetical protein